MCEREKVLERIKKLLALADNNNSEEEALAAALKAQKLIADYHVEQCELVDGINDEIESVESTKGTSRWRTRLAAVVGKNFRCKVWETHHGRSISSVHFYGYSMDANAAKLTYEKLYEVGERLGKAESRNAAKRHGTSSGVYQSFCLGFVAGVREEMEKQSVALMLVIPMEVNEAFAEMTNGFKTSRSHLTANSAGAYENGTSAGAAAVRSGRLGQGAHMLAEAR